MKEKLVVIEHIFYFVLKSIGKYVRSKRKTTH